MYKQEQEQQQQLYLLVEVILDQVPQGKQNFGMELAGLK